MDDCLAPRLPYFHPPSPGSRSALQHCSTTEIQLASTSMTGIEGDPEMETSTSYGSPIFKQSHELGWAPVEDSRDSAHGDGLQMPRISVTGERGMRLAKRMRERQSSSQNTETSQSSASERKCPMTSPFERSEEINGTGTLYVSRHIAPPSVTTPERQVSAAYSTAETSTFPEISSFMVPMEPLPSGTPVTKQLLAAKGIMRDTKTPGSGQSVRFFSRDTYCLNPRPDGSPVATLDSSQCAQSYTETERLTFHGQALFSPLPGDRPMTSKSPEQSSNIESPTNAGNSTVLLTESRQRDRQVCPSLAVEASQEVRPGAHLADVFGSTTPPVHVASISAVGSSTQRSISARSLSPSPSACRATIACPSQFETSLSGSDLEPGPRTSPPISGAADATTPPRSPLSSSQALRPQHSSPSLEVITLDQSSDYPISTNGQQSPAIVQGDSTIYLTPEKTSSQRQTTSPVETPPQQAGAALASNLQVAAETLFTAHERRIRSLCAERDGWKNLCEQLMTRHEAEMSSGARHNQPIATEIGHTSKKTDFPMTESSSKMQRSLDSGNSLTYRHQCKNLAEEPSSAEEPCNAKNDIQEELQDLRIRFQTVQRESQEERLKTDKWETMFRKEARAAEELRQDNERYIRDARDVDVRLELYARERESKVRHQLQAEMRIISAELDTMQRERQTLETALKQQGQADPSTGGVEQITKAAEEISHDDQITRVTRSPARDRSASPAEAELHSHNQDGIVISCAEALCDLKRQLQHAQQEQKRAAETYVLLESVQGDLAKEIELNAELNSRLMAQEIRSSTLQNDLRTEQDARTRESAEFNRQIAELQIAYNDQVKRNHEQYLELEEAMDDREAKFSERIAELEAICEQRQKELDVLVKEQSEVKLAEIATSKLRADLERTEKVLLERETRIEQFERSNEQQIQRIDHQDEVMAALKRGAADDVFKSTKRERRIEKLLHDREMLNIAVEQLQIHIQLVKRQYKARTGLHWDDEAQSSPSNTSRLSVAPQKMDHSISTPLGISKAINYSVERSTSRRHKELAR